MATMFVREMPVDERPSTRLKHLGAGFLSNAELLSLLIKDTSTTSGYEVAQELLREADGLAGIKNINLESFPGIGKGKSLELLALLELAKRLGERKERSVVTCPEDAADYAMPRLRYENKEHMCVMLLNVKNHIIAWEVVSVGSLTASVVHPREVFRPAIIKGAASIILVHNHPSGDPTPSTEDLEVTARMVQVGRIMDISVLDHIIIGGDSFVSMKEKGAIK
jgi:DNA repair protein RadC